jgi:hypothetical protein
MDNLDIIAGFLVILILGSVISSPIEIIVGCFLVIGKIFKLLKPKKEKPPPIPKSN